MNLGMMPTYSGDVGANFSGGVQNPYYEPPAATLRRPAAGHLPELLPRLQPYMDLRSRGQLSDEVVMKVRSEEAVPYRGVVFDEYNGKGWVISTGENAETLTSGARASTCSPPAVRAAQGPARQVAQVFHVEKDSSNVIFGAYRPRDGLLPDEHHQGGPVRLSEGAVPASPKARPTRSSPRSRTPPRPNSVQPARITPTT